MKSVRYMEVAVSGNVKRAPGSTVGGLFVIHHTNFIIDNGNGTQGEVRFPAHEVGRNGDIFPEESGWPMDVGAKVVWGNTHLHPSGVPGDRQARMDIGFRLHPAGYKPKYRMSGSGAFGQLEIEINPNEANQKAETYYVLPQAGKLVKSSSRISTRRASACASKRSTSARSRR